jgi:hypothetical protein
MTLPTIHLNGTSRADLQSGWDNAAEKLHDFMEAFGSIEFNARDYYVQGPSAWTEASDARYDINRKIREIRDYIDAHRAHLHS